jgi:hypothetical protein
VADDTSALQSESRHQQESPRPEPIADSEGEAMTYSGS